MVLDILLKWFYIKLTQSANTSLALKATEFLMIVFTYLDEQTEYTLKDHEAFVIIPFLCEKSGAYSQKPIMINVKNLIKLTFKLYDHRKVIELVFKFGLTSGNKKSIAEVLDELAYFISFHGSEFLKMAKNERYKLLMTLGDINDKGIREGVLHVISEDYKNLGNAIWDRIAKEISGKFRTVLEARLKTITTNV